MSRAEGSLVKDMKRGLAKVSHKKNSLSNLLVTLYGFDCALNFGPCQEPATRISNCPYTMQAFTPGVRCGRLLVGDGNGGPGGKGVLGYLWSFTGQRGGMEIYSWFKPICGCVDEVVRKLSAEPEAQVCALVLSWTLSPVKDKNKLEKQLSVEQGLDMLFAMSLR